jgi:FKBP-type peptidyl-prolyl cis-trans isomerase SlyD
MQIDKDTAVTITLRASDAAGKLINDGTQPTAYLHGGYDNIFPKLEEALQGQTSGFQTTLDLSAEDAFGQRDESLLRTIAKKDFPPGVKVGGQLEGYNDKGEQQVFNVLKIKGDTVYLDGNHPLAGQSLRVTVKVISVRPATGEEIAHRHVHGAHGHNH